MTVAWLITLLAIVGVVFGALGHARLPASQLAAAGGGLLTGICVFWLAPEIKAAFGWLGAFLSLLAVCAVLLVIDRFTGHAEEQHRHVLGPLLAAAALHSFFDGWSIRTMLGQTVVNIAVPVGIALHKLPEGLALGWVLRRTLPHARLQTTLLVASSIEILTAVGAFVQPYGDRSGSAAFGQSWTLLVLAIIGGTFLFLGLHAVIPNRKRRGISAIFLATFVATGLLSLLHAS